MSPHIQTEGNRSLANLKRVVHSLSERIEMIERSRWADELSWGQIKTLASYMEPYKVEQGRTVMNEGAHGDHMILIVQGQVNIVKTNTDQIQKVIATLGPGRTFGEMALIDGEPRSASAVAATHVSLLVLTKDSFVRLTKKSPHLSQSLVLKIAKLMSQRLRQVSGILIDYL